MTAVLDSERVLPQAVRRFRKLLTDVAEWEVTKSQVVPRKEAFKALLLEQSHFLDGFA